MKTRLFRTDCRWCPSKFKQYIKKKMDTHSWAKSIWCTYLSKAGCCKVLWDARFIFLKYHLVRRPDWVMPRSAMTTHYGHITISRFQKTTVSLVRTRRPEEQNHTLPLVYHQKAKPVITHPASSLKKKQKKKEETFVGLLASPSRTVPGHHQSLAPGGTRAPHTLRVSYFGDLCQSMGRALSGLA